MGNEWEKCPLIEKWGNTHKGMLCCHGVCSAELEALWWSVLKPLLEAGQKCCDEAHEIIITNGHPRNMDRTVAAEMAWDAALAAYRERVK